ncbi:hypothetical protein CM240_0817 [Clostridium bornimense]|uniref:GerMN domain-containing protein n=1 Tax=Clostridium bornimense TaxID=1216932 RepID=W6S122_9CLOT|nr:GerMN domain-containing protein [Clostridium bornimense]CDM67982.1 hypothetical protein CM240_0817 [Clostridium bornimense]
MKKLTIILLLICLICSLSSCEKESSKKATENTSKNKTISNNNADISDKSAKEKNNQNNTTNEESIPEPTITEDNSINNITTVTDGTTTVDNASTVIDNNVPTYAQPIQEPEQLPSVENTSNTKKKVVRIFSYNSLNDSISYFDKEVEVIDGALTKTLVEALKDPSIAAIPADAYVRSASIDRNNDMISINFGDKFIDTTKVGSTSEYYVLTATINTFCYNFGVSKALITQNGNPYESGHVSMAPGQTFSANYSECYSK